MRLDIKGCTVSRVYRNAFSTEIELDGDGDTGFALEQRYRLVRADRTFDIDPQVDDELPVRAAFDALIGVSVESAIAYESGVLSVRFEDGTLLECGPGDMYEPWSYWGPGRARIWSLPGGRLAWTDPE